jgi:DNA polymerase delta subunit 3
MVTRMLYDFHQKQNAKKPGTIHATYLLSGTRRPEDPIPPNGDAKKDGEDDYMQSSPFIGSSMPQLEEGTGESSVLSITLVREEDLEGGTCSYCKRRALLTLIADMRSQYEHISSIHIYSLEPHPLKVASPFNSTNQAHKTRISKSSQTQPENSNFLPQTKTP